jgi:hypothetical protein
MKRFLVFAAIVVAVTYYWLWWNIDRTLIQEAHSPSNKVIAFVHARGEGHDPPYGVSVDLALSWIPFPRYFSEMVFTGYCTGGLSLQWTSENDLTIICPHADEVKRQLPAWRSMKLTYLLS